MDYLLLIIGLLAGGVIGFLVAKLTTSKHTEEGIQNSQQLQIDNATLSNTNSRLEGELGSIKLELATVREAHQVELKKATEWESKHTSLSEKIGAQK